MSSPLSEQAVHIIPTIAPRQGRAGDHGISYCGIDRIPSRRVWEAGAFTGELLSRVGDRACRRNWTLVQYHVRLAAPRIILGAIRAVRIAVWTACDAKFFNVEMPEGTRMELQDRAYTSPIWYTPGM